MLRECEDDPAGDLVAGTLYACAVELFFDDELFNCTGSTTPRLWPMGNRVTRRDKRTNAFVAFKILHRFDCSTSLCAECFGFWREFHGSDDLDVLAEKVRNVDCGSFGVYKCLDCKSASQVQVSVVFPCESDAAVHLNIHLRIAVAGMCSSGRCHCRGVGELIATGCCRASGIPNFSGCDFCFNEHVGAVMLHGLEHGDCSAELLAVAGVVGCHVGSCTSHTSCFSGQ